MVFNQYGNEDGRLDFDFRLMLATITGSESVGCVAHPRTLLTNEA